MKKIAVFLAVLLLLAAPVLAAEPTEALSDVLGADELTQSLPDEAAEVLDGLSPDGTPDFRSGVRSILRAAAGGSGGALRSGLRLCAVLLAMVTLCAVVRMSTQKDPVNAVSAVGALGICAACLGGMQSMISLASETVTRLSDDSACLLPVMASAMAMSGGTVSAGALYAGTALFSGLLSRLIARLLLPGVSVYLVVAAAEAALADSLLSELREFVGWLISKSLRVVLFGFDKDQALSEHTAAMPVTIQVLEGKLRVGGEGREVELVPGGVVYLSARLPHTVYAVEPSKMLLSMFDNRG